MDHIIKAIKTIEDSVRELRHDLHRNPELGYEEYRTAATVREFMGDLNGAEIESGIAGTGMVVLLGKDKPGPCVALRADMDALAIEEESDVPWRSGIPGKMHACGHDGHTAMLAGAARIIAEHADDLKGPVKLIFQPAEEGGAGGDKMVKAGVLKNPDVAAIYGLHNNLPEPSGKIGNILYASGASMAGAGTFNIEITGKGGHAAFPHKCVDPLYIGTGLVQQLQGIVSRMVDPLAPAVVSVTRFHCGTAHNIISSKAKIQGTFRALSEDLMTQIAHAIEKLAMEFATAHGAKADVMCNTGYPPLINDPRAESVFRNILKEIGEEARLKVCEPIMGGEDFAYFAREVPGFFYFLPMCPEGEDVLPMCHHPAYDFNDDLLVDGMRLHVETALRFARHWSS